HTSWPRDWSSDVCSSDLAVGPSVARGRDTAMLREILDRTAERVEKDLGSEPEVQADLNYTLGSTYGDLGEAQEAEPILQRAVEEIGRASCRGRVWHGGRG